MTTVQHSTLTGSSLHEPKGVAASAVNKVYVSDGSGSGSWKKLTFGTEINTPLSATDVLYGPKAWVSFTVSGTTPTIQKSYNVASVTRSSTGVYAITFTSAMTDAYYTICPAVGSGNDVTYVAISKNAVPTVNGFTIGVTNATTYVDPTYATITIFGN